MHKKIAEDSFDKIVQLLCYLLYKITYTYLYNFYRLSNRIYIRGISLYHSPFFGHPILSSKLLTLAIKPLTLHSKPSTLPSKPSTLSSNFRPPIDLSIFPWSTVKQLLSLPNRPFFYLHWLVFIFWEPNYIESR